MREGKMSVGVREGESGGEGREGSSGMWES